MSDEVERFKISDGEATWYLVVFPELGEAARSVAHFAKPLDDELSGSKLGYVFSFGTYKNRTQHSIEIKVRDAGEGIAAIRRVPHPGGATPMSAEDGRRPLDAAGGPIESFRGDAVACRSLAMDGMARDGLPRDGATQGGEAMALEHELSVYRTNLGSLMANEGKFVVIKGDEILPNAYDDYESATAAGYQRFGPVSFLVKKISRTEPVLYFSRDL